MPTVTGGIAPFAYKWSNAATTPSVSVGIGTYQVTVTDANGCSASDEIVVMTGSSNLKASIRSGNNGCNGGKDGRIFITVLSGTLPYSYSIDNGTTWSANANYYNLFSGEYKVVVREAGGCTYAETVTITEPTRLLSRQRSLEAPSKSRIRQVAMVHLTNILSTTARMLKAATYSTILRRVRILCGSKTRLRVSVQLSNLLW